MLPHGGHTLQQRLHSTYNSHECDDQCEWNVSVWFLCTISAFCFCVGRECCFQTYYILRRKKSTKLYFLGGMLKSVEFIIWVLQIGTAVYFVFSFKKHKRGAVVAKNVNLPPRQSYFLLCLRSFLLFIILFWNAFQWTNNGTNFDVR